MQWVPLAVSLPLALTSCVAGLCTISLIACNVLDKEFEHPYSSLSALLSSFITHRLYICYRPPIDSYLTLTKWLLMFRCLFLLDSQEMDWWDMRLEEWPARHWTEWLLIRNYVWGGRGGGQSDSWSGRNIDQSVGALEQLHTRSMSDIWIQYVASECTMYLP